MKCDSLSSILPFWLIHIFVQPREKLDLPPGGFPEYLTEVKDPGPALGGCPFCC